MAFYGPERCQDIQLTLDCSRFPPAADCDRDRVICLDETDASQMAIFFFVFQVTFVISVLLVFVYKNLVTEETVSISIEERGKCRQLLVKRMTAIFKKNINVNA
jgi:hypothetical protein